MPEVQNLVSVEPWTFAAQICNLLIQMALLKKFLFGPIRDVLARRQAQAEEGFRKAREAQEKALDYKSKYEKNLSEVRNQADELLARARQTAQAEADEILRRADQEAAGLREKADREIARQRRKTMHAMHDEISTIALELAEKVVEHEVRENDHQKLIRDFIAKVGDAS